MFTVHWITMRSGYARSTCFTQEANARTRFDVECNAKWNAHAELRGPGNVLMLFWDAPGHEDPKTHDHA